MLYNLNKRMYVIFVFLLLLILWGCQKNTYDNSNEKEIELFGDKESIFGNVEAPKGFDWRQCEGIVLDFIVEDNINANILSRECDKFTEVTGIKVNVKSMEFNTLIEKINMEFIAQTEQYEVIYVDPYQTLSRFSDNLEDLYKYENNKDIPHIVGGLDSFKKEHLEICSYFMDKNKLCAIPFDSTTMVLFYRKDIFDKYKEGMTRDLGYEPLPGTDSFTWERYIEVSEWISNNVPDTEVKYGSLSMMAYHNSIYTEFSNILSAYGGDYFWDEYVSNIGTLSGSDIITNPQSFKAALEIYQKLAELNPSTPGDWNWSKVAETFKKGEVAMMVNWDENSAATENDTDSKVAGKVGYSILPYGTERSANIFGGSGIGINSNISEEKKLASWLFIVWATSPQIQLKAFLEEGGGNMPTRTDTHRLIEAEYMPKAPHAFSAIMVQKEPYAYYRPKMKRGYEFETIITDNLYQMVNDKIDVDTVIENIKSQWADVKKKH